MSRPRSPNLVVDDDYKFPISRFRLAIFMVVIFVAAFVLTFPIKTIIGNAMNTAMNANPNCKIQYANMDFGLFLPKIIFNDVQIPRGCLAPTQKDMTFKAANVGFGGISFSPLGVVATVGVTLGKNTLDLKIASNGSTHSVRIDEQKVDLDDLIEKLKDIAPIPVQLSGKAILDLKLLTHPVKTVEKINLTLTSKNLVLPSQSINNFGLSTIEIGRVDVELSGHFEKLVLKKLELGGPSAALELKSKGSIQANYQVPAASRLDLDMDLKLGPKLQNEFGILDLVLGAYKKSDGNYQFSLQGPLSGVQPAPKR